MTVTAATRRGRGLGAALLALGMVTAGVAVATSAPASATGAATTEQVAQRARCPWMDTSKSPARRAAELVDAMTLDQKIAMVHSTEPQMGAWYGTAGHIAAIPELCIPDLVLNDAGAGVSDDQVGTTAFPAGIAQASSWDPALQRRMGAGLGREASRKGINVMLAPGVNIARTPLNGRNFEYAGEDPYLAGEVGAAITQGIQSQHVLATVKHYALNNQERDRMTVSAEVGERALHEIYLPAFETTVRKGRVGSVMCSYNRIGGTYACGHRTMLQRILERQLGFRGFVMSDWGAVHATSYANAGLDMEMAVSDNGKYFGDALKQAVRSGAVPRSRLDDMVRRITREMFQVGIFEHPPAAQPAAFASVATTPDSVALAREVAEQGSVLLKNDRSVLPLRSGQTIAVIGKPAGAWAEYTYGGMGSSHVMSKGPVPVVTPLQGMLERAQKAGSRIIYADGTVLADAVAAASVADVAVVWAYDAETEGVDRGDLSLKDAACVPFTACPQLPVSQDDLISRVAAANPHTAVVLNTGGPVLMPWISEVESVLETWYPGQENGHAVARLLFGDVNPAGKLVQTFPRSERDLSVTTPRQYPGVDGRAHYTEGLDVGYRWFDRSGTRPLFAFGHGLSYTTFGYSDLAVTRTRSGARVSFTVTNTGRRAGAEVAQVYVGAPSVSHEPPKQLKAFRKVYLQPGQSTRVTLRLGARAFARWSTRQHTWVVDSGRYRILVGTSSQQLPLRGGVRRPARVLAP